MRHAPPLSPQAIRPSRTRIPVGGQVSCGFPSPAADHQQAELSLDELVGLGPRSSLFMLRAWGDSMQGEGIYDGDVLIVDKGATARVGNIVVAVIDGEFLVKTVAELPDGSRVLEAANPDYPPIPISEDQTLLIWGVCKWNLHQLT
ncbi:LexA family protein [Marinobacter sp.]|uniref:LexA family protein n=1 Tax=Marinobacter sp. TaxID=50741 RepID=UPI003A8F4FCB